MLALSLVGVVMVIGAIECVIHARLAAKDLPLHLTPEGWDTVDTSPSDYDVDLGSDETDDLSDTLVSEYWQD